MADDGMRTYRARTIFTGAGFRTVKESYAGEFDVRGAGEILRVQAAEKAAELEELQRGKGSWVPGSPSWQRLKELEAEEAALAARPAPSVTRPVEVTTKVAAPSVKFTPVVAVSPFRAGLGELGAGVLGRVRGGAARAETVTRKYGVEKPVGFFEDIFAGKQQRGRVVAAEKEITERESELSKRVVDYEKGLSAYEKKVEASNKRGGAKPEEFKMLEAERRELGGLYEGILRGQDVLQRKYEIAPSKFPKGGKAFGVELPHPREVSSALVVGPVKFFGGLVPGALALVGRPKEALGEVGKGFGALLPEKVQKRLAPGWGFAQVERVATPKEKLLFATEFAATSLVAGVAAAGVKKVLAPEYKVDVKTMGWAEEGPGKVKLKGVAQLFKRLPFAKEFKPIGKPAPVVAGVRTFKAADVVKVLGVKKVTGKGVIHFETPKFEVTTAPVKMGFVDVATGAKISVRRPMKVVFAPSKEFVDVFSAVARKKRVSVALSAGKVSKRFVVEIPEFPKTKFPSKIRGIPETLFSDMIPERLVFPELRPKLRPKVKTVEFAKFTGKELVAQLPEEKIISVGLFKEIKKAKISKGKPFVSIKLKPIEGPMFEALKKRKGRVQGFFTREAVDMVNQMKLQGIIKPPQPKFPKIPKGEGVSFGRQKLISRRLTAEYAGYTKKPGAFADEIFYGKSMLKMPKQKIVKGEAVTKLSRQAVPEEKEFLRGFEPKKVLIEVKKVKPSKLPGQLPESLNLPVSGISKKVFEEYKFPKRKKSYAEKFAGLKREKGLGYFERKTIHSLEQGRLGNVINAVLEKPIELRKQRRIIPTVAAEQMLKQMATRTLMPESQPARFIPVSGMRSKGLLVERPMFGDKFKDYYKNMVKANMRIGEKTAEKVGVRTKTKEKAIERTKSAMAEAVKVMPKQAMKPWALIGFKSLLRTEIRVPTRIKIIDRAKVMPPSPFVMPKIPRVPGGFVFSLPKVKFKAFKGKAVKFKQKTGYVPSFIGVAFGIKGKAPKISTGFGIGPIPLLKVRGR